MEENNDIFLAGGDALVHLAGPMHKKYSKIIISRRHFFADVIFFCHFKIKLEKKTYTQTNTCLYKFQGILDIFKYIYFTLYL